MTKYFDNRVQSASSVEFFAEIRYRQLKGQKLQAVAHIRFPAPFSKRRAASMFADAIAEEIRDMPYEDESKLVRKFGGTYIHYEVTE